MTAQDFNVKLKEFPDGWRANFYLVGIAHSSWPVRRYEPTPWAAVQRAAWEALVNNARGAVEGERRNQGSMTRTDC